MRKGEADASIAAYTKAISLEPEVSGFWFGGVIGFPFVSRSCSVMLSVLLSLVFFQLSECVGCGRWTNTTSIAATPIRCTLPNHLLNHLLHHCGITGQVHPSTRFASVGHARYTQGTTRGKMLKGHLPRVIYHQVY